MGWCSPNRYAIYIEREMDGWVMNRIHFGAVRGKFGYVRNIQFQYLSALRLRHVYSLGVAWEIMKSKRYPIQVTTGVRAIESVCQTFGRIMSTSSSTPSPQSSLCHALLPPVTHGICCSAVSKTAASAKASGSSGKGAWKGHAGAVSGIGVDAVNKTMVSAGVDGLLAFWAFKDKRINGAVAVGSGISQLELVRGDNRKHYFGFSHLK